MTRIFKNFVRQSGVLALSAFILVGCSHTREPEGRVEASVDPQGWVDQQASNLVVRYRVLANKGEGGCEFRDSPAAEKRLDGPCSEVELSLQTPAEMSANALERNWAIYFSQVDPFYKLNNPEFTVEHINGDLHRIRPTGLFTGFKKGEKKVLPMLVKGLTLTEAKLMPNYYIVAEGQNVHSQARVIDSTRVVIDPETGLETRPYAAEIPRQQFRLSKADQTPYADAEYLFEENAFRNSKGLLTAQQVKHAILPTPAQQVLGAGEVDLSNGFNLLLKGVEEEQLSTALLRLNQLGLEHTKSGFPLNVSVKSSLASRLERERYSLSITPIAIHIHAADAAGAFYGLQSLAALLTVDSTFVPLMEVKDAPRYPYRGMHIDVGRNFHSKQLLIDVMDQMAAYKLNKLHLHLGEDEGWRLQIPDLPELTDVGGKRCHDQEENTCLKMQLGADVSGASARDGYYSRADYIELVKAAKARHIQLIPSFDMPGHSRAAVKAMEARYRRYMAQGNKLAAQEYLLSDLQDKTEYLSIQYYTDNTINACMESPYHFLGKVIDEVQAMHEEAGQPLTVYHIGADETAGAWKDSPICKHFFQDNAYGVKSAEELGPYFIQRVASLLAEKGIRTAGWSDGLSHTDPNKMPVDVQSNIWDVLPWAGVKEANQQANRGWDVVLSNPDALYFDFPYEPEPKEGGYYWGSRHIDTHKVFIFMPGNLPALAEVYPSPAGVGFEINDSNPLKEGVSWAGIQGQLWSETIRSETAVEYMVFPRLLALAERAWHKPEWELPYDYNGASYGPGTHKYSETLRVKRDQDWLRFASVLGHKEFPKMEQAGIEFRIPTVGAKIVNGVLHANLVYPGLFIEFREVQEGNAHAFGEWSVYSKPIAVKGQVQVRAVAPGGQRKGRAITVNALP